MKTFIRIMIPFGARGCDYFVFHFDVQVDSRVEVCLYFMMKGGTRTSL
jgi:hypothetical protein